MKLSILPTFLSLLAVVTSSFAATPVVHPPHSRALEGGETAVQIVTVEAKEQELWVRAQSGSAGLGTDFEASGGKLTFTAEDRVAEFVLRTIDDTELEPEESILLQLSASSDFSTILQEVSISLVDNETPWILDRTFNAFDGPVQPVVVGPRQMALNPVKAVELLPDGKVVAGGTMASQSGVYRGLVRLLANGEVDETFRTGTSIARVYGLATDPGGNVYASVTLEGRKSALVKVSTNGAVVWALPVEVGGPVLVSPEGSRILVGGNFTAVGDEERNHIAAVSPEGAVLRAFHTELNGEVVTMAWQADGKLLIGGKFTSVNGVARRYLARLTATGELDETFDPGTLLTADALALAVQEDERILVSGHFGMGYPPIGRLHRLNSDGSLDTSFTTGLDEPAYAVSIDSDDRIVLAGAFNRVNGETRHRLARLLPNGALDASYDSGVGPNAPVNDLVIAPDGSYVIGGHFTKVGRSEIPGIARVFSHTSTIAVDFVDREFSAGEQHREAVVNLQRYGDSSGELVVDVWTEPGTDPELAEFTALSREVRFGAMEVTKMVIIPFADDGEVELHERLTVYCRARGTEVIGSAFIKIIDDEVPVVVTGRIPSGPHMYYRQDPAKQMAQWGNRIAVGGPVQAADTGFDFAHLGVNVITTDGTPSGFAPATFTRNENGRIHQLAWMPDGKLLVGGEFTEVNGVPRMNLVRLYADGSIDMGFNPQPPGWVYEVVAQTDGKALVTDSAVVRLNMDGSVDPSFNLEAPASSLRFQSDGKIIGLQPNGRLGRFMPNGAVDTAFHSPEWGVTKFSMLADDKILVGGHFTEVHGVLRVGFARLNSDGSVDMSFKPPIAVSEPTFIPVTNGSVLLGNYNSPNWSLLNENGSLNPDFVFRDQYAVHPVMVLNDGRVLGLNFEIISTTNTALTSVQFATSTITLPESVGTHEVSVERVGRIAGESIFPVTVGLVRGEASGDIVAESHLTFGAMVRTQALHFSVALDDLIETDEVYRLSVGQSEATMSPPTVEITILDRDGRPGAFRIVPELSGRKDFTRVAAGADGRVLLYGFSDEPLTLYNPESGQRIELRLLADERMYVRTAVAHGDGFLVGVSPLATGPGAVGQVYRVTSTGSWDASFKTVPLNIAPRDIFVEAGGTILVAGTALWQPNLPSYHVARLNADGSIKETFPLVENYHAGALLAGGKLVYKSHYSIRTYDLNTREAARSFKTVDIASDWVEQIVAAGEQFYVMGAFKEINGIAVTNLARVNADGTLDQTFAPRLNLGNLTSIALDTQGRLLVFGMFESVNDVVRRHGVRLNRDGSTDASFDPGLSLISGGWPGLVKSTVSLPSGELFAVIQFPNTSDPWRAAVVTSDLPFRGALVINNGALEYRLLTAPQTSYRVESSPDLFTWREIRSTNAPGYQVHIPITNSAERQFFRARTN